MTVRVKKRKRVILVNKNFKYLLNVENNANLRKDFHFVVYFSLTIAVA